MPYLIFCQIVRKTIREENGYDPIIDALTRFGHGQIDIARVITVKDSGPIRHIRKIGDLNSCGIVSKICIPEKCLMLYYYAFANPIPLYLHITMSHDNSNCLFFTGGLR